jgi:hypothetical protein
VDVKANHIVDCRYFIVTLVIFFNFQTFFGPKEVKLTGKNQLICRYFIEDPNMI